MKYAKNYLSQVIFRLDFDPILALSVEVPAKFQERIKEEWPRSSQGEEIEFGTVLSPENKVNTVSRRKRWTFAADDGAKSITVTDSSFFIEYKEYKDVHLAERDFEFLWKQFQACYELRTLNRIGLRYIDEIVLPIGMPTDWAGYLAPEIIAAVLSVPEPLGHSLTRSLSSISWLAEDHRMNFTFGLSNSDFPNPLVKREFVLDFDCFSVSSVPATDAETYLVSYNKVIHQLFESSIGELLRTDMVILEDDRKPIGGTTNE